MNRFLKFLVILTVSLFLLVSGVNAALDRLAHSPAQSFLGVYNEKGMIVMAYDGDLNNIKAMAKPGQVVASSFLHRT